VLASVATQSKSQQADYPTKVVRWVLPTAAGSPSDVMVRKIAIAVQPNLGATIIIDNKPGASGTLGANEVAKASPDGYTLLVGILDPLISSVALMKSPPYDATKDFRPVTKLIKGGAVMLANKDFKPNTLQEFVAFAKAAKEPIDYGTIGPVSFMHYIMEALAKQTGAKVRPVHYRAAPQAIQALIGNEVAVTFGGPALAAPMMAEGKIKAYAVMGDTRIAPIPNVPTFAEAGINGFVYRTVITFGMFAPAKTPDAVLSKLVAAIQKSLSDPELRKFVEAAGFEVIASSSAEFEKDFLIEHAEITKLIRDLGMSAD